MRVSSCLKKRSVCHGYTSECLLCERAMGCDTYLRHRYTTIKKQFDDADLVNDQTTKKKNKK